MTADRTSLYSAIIQYQQVLTQIEQNSPNSEDILELLLARDTVQNILSQDNSPTVTSHLSRLTKLDQRLFEQKKTIVAMEDYSRWRKSFQPPESYWWWYFLSMQRFSWWQQLDWLWNSLSIVFWTISVSLIADGVARLLSGGLDTLSILAIIIPSILALLTSGNLTPIGKGIKEYFSQKFNRFILTIVNLFISFALFVSLVITHQFFYDNLAVYFHDRGLNFYQQGQLEQALANYHKAIALDHGYSEAHYNSGIVYEDLQQLDKAQTEYLLSVQKDDGSNNSLISLKAYNNWGRLLILEKKYVRAITPLIEGKNALDEQKVQGEPELQQVQYALLKNLGWTHLELKNYSSAESLLNEAIAVQGDKAPAYCLLAQLWEARSQEQKALDNWNLCLVNADSTSPDEYFWLSIAREKVK